MAARFREVAPNSGVDEKLPSGAQGIVVPSGGSTLVILQEGKGLDVRSTVPSRVHVHEFKTEHERTDAARNASISASVTGNVGINPAYMLKDTWNPSRTS